MARQRNGPIKMTGQTNKQKIPKVVLPAPGTPRNLPYEERALTAVIQALGIPNEAAVRSEIEELRLTIIASAKSIFGCATAAAHLGLSLDIPEPKRLSNVVLLAALAQATIRFTNKLEILGSYTFGVSHDILVCGDTAEARLLSPARGPPALLPCAAAVRLIADACLPAVFMLEGWHDLAAWKYNSSGFRPRDILSSPLPEFLAQPDMSPDMVTYDFDGVSGATDLRNLSFLKNPLSIKIKINEVTWHVHTKARTIVLNPDTVIPAASRPAMLLGRVMPELGELRVHYVFKDADASATKKQYVATCLAQVIEERREQDGLWGAAYASMEPKGAIHKLLIATVPTECIQTLFIAFEQKMRREAEGACLYIEHYGGKGQTLCTSRDELFAKLARALDCSRFPDCTVDVCCTVGYRGDRATFASPALTAIFPSSATYSLFCCKRLQNVHLYTQKSVRNKLIFACPPLQKINFYNVVEDLIRPFWQEKFYPKISGCLMRTLLLDTEQAAARLDRELQEMLSSALTFKIAHGLPLRLEVRVQVSALNDTVNWLESLISNADNFVTCETSVIGTSLRENIDNMLSMLGRHIRNRDFVRTVATETFFQEMFCKGGANRNLAPAETVVIRNRLLSNSELPAVPVDMFDNLHVTPQMQASTCESLIKYYPGINNAAAENLHLINSFSILASESAEQHMAEQLLSMYESEFAAYYRLAVQTLVSLPPALTSLVSRCTKTVPEFMRDVFGPKTEDRCFEKMVFRRCFLVALSSLSEPNSLREEVVAALHARRWNYCYVIPEGGLSRRRGARFHRLSFTVTAAPPVYITVPACPEDLAQFMVTNAANNIERPSGSGGRIQLHRKWDEEEEARFLNLLVLKSQDRVLSFASMQQWLLYGWCFTRPTSSLRDKHRLFVRNPALIGRLLPASIRWKPACFSIPERIKYCARFGVNIEEQAASLETASAREAESWVPPTKASFLSFITNDVITADESELARLAEIVERCFEPEYLPPAIEIALTTANDAVLATDVNDAAREIHKAPRANVHAVSHAAAAAPAIVVDEELTPPSRVIRPGSDEWLLNKLRASAQGQAFSVGMLRRKLFSSRNRPEAAHILAQLQRLADAGMVRPIPPRGRAVLPARQKYVLVRNTGLAIEES
jgi:hypothetical protein